MHRVPKTGTRKGATGIFHRLLTEGMKKLGAKGQDKGPIKDIVYEIQHVSPLSRARRA